MENLDGALGFRATLDIDDFNVSAQAMERHIQHASANIQSEYAQMDQSLLQFAQKGAMYIESYLVGQGMYSLLNSIVQVRGQFQQLEIAFGTMLGSEEKANALMQQMIQTAAHTPFDLQGVAGGAKQLLAYGESADKVNDTLVRLGNIASGLSIPLNDIVYLYGTTMVQGRLYAQDVRQFTGRGIPLVRELAEMYGVTAEEINNMVSAGKIGFPEVQTVLNKLTNEGGQFYNLMEKQSASLTGQISNLEDAWDSMLNDIGKKNQDTFASAISGASYLVEHYDTILGILKAVAVGYGTVKAAVVLNTLATKGYTGVALLDNTARQAKLALLKAEAVATGQVKAQQDLMIGTERAHVAALEAELTAEELANVKKQIRIATITSLLTVQQQEYLSNLGLTASSEGYEAAAMGVLTVEQQQAVSKLDLTAKSAAYRVALEQEVMAKKQGTAASLEAMRTEVKAAHAKMEAAKTAAVASMQSVEAARYEVYWAKQSGDATRIATAQKKLEGATENQAIARKAALAANTDFYSKKKALETAAVASNTTAHAANAAAEGVQAASTNLLTAAATKATMAMRALWASMMSNPIGWITAAIGALVSIFTLWGDEEEEQKTVMGEFQDATNKEIESLNTLFAVLQTTESGTKTHQATIEKINKVCQDYNKTLLTENDTLDDQKAKYEELRVAIQETTAEKLKAKYAEQALQEQADANAESLKKLKEQAEDAIRIVSTNTMATSAGAYTQVITEDLEHIQNASEAVWDAVEMMANEKAAELAKLPADAYQQAFDKSLEQILETVQRSTNATDTEIAEFKRNISRYLSDVTQNTIKAQAEIAKVDSQLKAFYSEKPDPTPITESTDLVSMTFEELKTKIDENEKKIQELNAQIIDPKTDPTKINELKQTLQDCLTLQGKLNGAIETKESNLNTENGIQARIKQLKEERADVEINSQKYKTLSTQIQRLQGKLPGTGTGGGGRNNREQAAKTYADKELEAQRKLEEERISVMEEGYAKRKATLDLQHQRALDQINKEERELAEQRKKAGKGALTAELRAEFEERRNLENQSYSTEQIKLFDGEIDYKKNQYQAYFNWVKNVGEDVANKHFKSLIAEGSSFTAWINSQIQKLEEKKASDPNNFSDGDANALNALKLQQQELTGAKSAMDLFKESVRQTVGQATNLAGKLEAIADLKERLANGDFHLNADETTQAAADLNSQDQQAQMELQQTLLKDYQTFEEQKTAIQKQYALLRSEAERMNDEERINQVNRAESEALSTLNASMLMQTESWRNLFSDLDSLTTEQIDKLISEIQEKMNTADLNLSPTDLKTVLDQLDKAKAKILDTNPFKALGNALNNVFKTTKDGSKKSTAQIKSDFSNLSKATQASFDFLIDAVNNCEVLGDVLGDTGKAAISTLSGIATAGIAMASAIKTAEKGSVILAAISIALQAIQFVASLFNDDKKHEEKIKRLQLEIDSLSRSYGRLERAFNNTYWVFSDAQREAYEANISLIQSEIDALEQQRVVAQQSWDFVAYAKLTKQIEELKKSLSVAVEQGDMLTLYEAEVANLRAQQEKIYQQIDEEQDKKDPDASAISGYYDKIEQIEEKIEDLGQSMHDTFAGTTVKNAIDEFADALVEAFQQGEDAADALGAKTKEVLKNAVLEALKRRFLAKGINDAVDYLSEAMHDNDLSAEEREEFERMVNEAGMMFNTALAGMGDLLDIDTEDMDALTGAVASMSEETGGVIAGRLNAVIINQSQILAVTRDQLAYQAQIAQNTAVSAERLSSIEQTLKRIETKDSSLLSQGIS